MILEGLAAAFPQIPVVAEESVCSGRVPDISGGTGDVTLFDQGRNKALV